MRATALALTLTAAIGLGACGEEELRRSGEDVQERTINLRERAAEIRRQVESGELTSAEAERRIQEAEKQFEEQLEDQLTP